MNINTRTLQRWSPWLYAALSLAPLVWCWSSVADLFWFGDDWDLLDQIWRHGFWTWAFQPFAESYTPLFKTMWGGMVFAGGGTYAPMIILNWVLHALNVALFALWLRRHEFGVGPTAITLLGFGLSTAHLETLGWSVQVSMILAQTFFFAAVIWCDRQGGAFGRWPWRDTLILFALVAGSALSFARGVLTGLTIVAVALLGMLAARNQPSPGKWARLRLLAVCLIPSLVVTYVIARYAGGNQHKLFGTESVLGPAAEYGAYYLLVAPFFWLLEFETWGWRTVMLLGLSKVLFFVVGWKHATPTQRQVLVTLIVLDLGTAALLGLGRYHTGLHSVTASRYQYISLCCWLPFVAIALHHWWTLVPLPPRWRPIGAGIALCALAWHFAHDWTQDLEHWAGWRGREARRILFEDPNPPAEGAIPGIPFLATSRAKEIVEHYQLH